MIKAVLRSLCFMLIVLRVEASISITRDAEFESAENRKLRGPMNYLVGSDPVLLCRLKNLNLIFNASQMTIKPPLRYPSTRKLNITVMDDYVIKLTLNNATTQDSNTYYCKGPPNGSLTLDSVVVNVGYAPHSDDVSISCQMYPLSNITCCLSNISQHLLNNRVKTFWKMEFHVSSLRTPVQGQNYTQINKNVCDTLWINEQSRFSITENDVTITARVTVNNSLGQSQTNVTFRPMDEVNPGPVRDLTVTNNPNISGQSVATWSHPENLTLFYRQQMGNLTYHVTFHSPLDVSEHEFVFVTSGGEQVSRSVNLMPNTIYNVTVFASGANHRGPATSVQFQTDEDVPLEPSITAWSIDVKSLTIYWKKYQHYERRGVITFFEVRVLENGTENDWTSYSLGNYCPDQTVPVACCRSGCRLSLTSNTKKGKSPPAEIAIPSVQQIKMDVAVERENGTHVVSWEKSDNVNSVHWCFGAFYAADSSLIRCRTEIQTKLLTPENLSSRTVTLSRDSLDLSGQDTSSPCENCNWRFAIGIKDGAGAHRTILLVWSKCIYEGYGAAPLPEIHVLPPSSEVQRSIRVSLGSCAKDEPAQYGKPLELQSMFGPAQIGDSCSRVLGNKQSTTATEMLLKYLEPGVNYTVCARIRTKGGWGEWASASIGAELQQTQNGSLKLMLGLVLSFGAVLLALIVGAIRYVWKQKLFKFLNNSFPVPKLRKHHVIEKSSHPSNATSPNASQPPPSSETEDRNPNGGVVSNSSSTEHPYASCVIGTAPDVVFKQGVLENRSRDLVSCVSELSTLPGRTCSLLGDAHTDQDFNDVLCEETSTLHPGYVIAQTGVLSGGNLCGSHTALPSEESGEITSLGDWQAGPEHAMAAGSQPPFLACPLSAERIITSDEWTARPESPRLYQEQDLLLPVNQASRWDKKRPGHSRQRGEIIPDLDDTEDTALLEDEDVKERGDAKGACYSSSFILERQCKTLQSRSSEVLRPQHFWSADIPKTKDHNREIENGCKANRITVRDTIGNDKRHCVSETNNLLENDRLPIDRKRDNKINQKLEEEGLDRDTLIQENGSLSNSNEDENEFNRVADEGHLKIVKSDSLNPRFIHGSEYVKVDYFCREHPKSLSAGNTMASHC